MIELTKHELLRELQRRVRPPHEPTPAEYDLLAIHEHLALLDRQLEEAEVLRLRSLLQNHHHEAAVYSEMQYVSLESRWQTKKCKGQNRLYII